MVTDQRERDFAQVGGLRYPGRFDPRLLQNVANAGDGFPGLQRAVRNWVKYYLTNGVIESDIDMTSKNINMINNLDVNGDADIEGNVDVNGTLDIHNITTITGDTTIVGATDITGDITVTGTVDTIDLQAHQHDNTAGNGTTIPGQLIAWKQDYDSFHSTTSTSFVDTDASITINLPEDSTVLITWKTEYGTDAVTQSNVYLTVNDGSDLLETQQFSSSGGGAITTWSPFGGSYVKNYSAGSTTWKLRMKVVTGTGTFTHLVLTVMAFKQLTEA